jgi:hypothetical protein
MRPMIAALVVLAPALALAGPLKASVQYVNIKEGYDHLNRMEVYVDGQLVATSADKLESKKNKVKFQLPPAAQNVRLLNYALYEGTWEEHTYANNYSIDCVWETPVSGIQGNRLDLICDVDSGPRLK